jgi:hypothetical protein
MRSHWVEIPLVITPKVIRSHPLYTANNNHENHGLGRVSERGRTINMLSVVQICPDRRSSGSHIRGLRVALFCGANKSTCGDY